MLFISLKFIQVTKKKSDFTEPLDNFSITNYELLLKCIQIVSIV